MKAENKKFRTIHLSLGAIGIIFHYVHINRKNVSSRTNGNWDYISLCTYISDYKDCVSNDIRSRNFLLLLVYAEVSRCS